MKPYIGYLLETKGAAATGTVFDHPRHVQNIINSLVAECGYDRSDYTISVVRVIRVGTFPAKGEVSWDLIQKEEVQHENVW